MENDQAKMETDQLSSEVRPTRRSQLLREALQQDTNLRDALKRANALIGEQADEMKAMDAKIQQLESALMSQKGTTIVLPGDEDKSKPCSPFNVLYGLRNKHTKHLVDRAYLDMRIGQRKPELGHLCEFYAVDYNQMDLGNRMPAVFLTYDQAHEYHGKVPYFDGENLEVFKITL